MLSINGNAQLLSLRRKAAANVTPSHQFLNKKNRLLPA